jgi:cytochrome c-type biogenesis protein CcmH/NrfG
MAKTSRMNLVFGSAVALLAALALVGMYLNRNLPVVAEAPASAFDPGRLPENHPPVDASARIAAAEQLTRDNPKNAEYKSELGNAYYDAGQYEKAAQAYRESLELQPDNPSVETDLATSYHYLGRHDQALELFDKVLKQHPGFSQALFNKGVVLQVGKKDVSGAVAAWEELMRSDPGFAQRADLERKIGELKSQMK